MVLGRARGGFEGDLVAESFELADVVALGAFGSESDVVEVRCEVVEVGFVLGQDTPDDDQHGSADRDDGLLLSVAPGDLAVALTKAGVGLADSDGGFPSTRTR
jgi:hypothetical protein